ncbi:MAG TPA: hypothetical protein PLG06_03220, partial [Anaerolineae bacterium]|nr:hypothetical protein [Anaerolineae bacterium]
RGKTCEQSLISAHKYTTKPKLSKSKGHLPWGSSPTFYKLAKYAILFFGTRSDVLAAQKPDGAAHAGDTCADCG